MRSVPRDAGLRGPAVAAAMTLIATVASWCPPAEAQPQTSTAKGLAWQLDVPNDLPAPVQQAAVDTQSGSVLLATLGGLFEVRDSKARSTVERPHPEARLVLAPGGGLYTWMIPYGGPEPRYFADLFDTDGHPLATLRMDNELGGFGALYLGFQGRLIVTATALDDWRGIRGRYLYTFWSREGESLARIERPTPEIGIVGADGSSLLLLGQDSASAYASDGEFLWKIAGEYRKGAIANGGKTALLNPKDKEEIDRVRVIVDGYISESLEMPTAVHHLRLTPDGALGAVGGNRGRYFFVEPQTGDFEEGERPPFDAELFLADLEFIDHETIALGVLLRTGEPPRHAWPRGGLAVVTREGEIPFRGDYPIREPFASRPAVEVTFGIPTVVGFTLDTAVRVDLGRSRR